ncbi:hypothetical protein PoB_002562300 [Plakobranchus ocellatus]|uniref:Uncharacterized protein n=1 Tax=Plakobranchus ocellatus TaxID=259542 RepID=A0AAV3ZXE4_9GAST|nr:hypothetical protein PoB_002562300 [Plakobranchus ocellatus]
MESLEAYTLAQYRSACRLCALKEFHLLPKRFVFNPRRVGPGGDTCARLTADVILHGSLHQAQPLSWGVSGRRAHDLLVSLDSLLARGGANKLPEIHLEDGGAWVARVEKHQFRFAQVHRGQHGGVSTDCGRRKLHTVSQNSILQAWTTTEGGGHDGDDDDDDDDDDDGGGGGDDEDHDDGDNGDDDDHDDGDDGDDDADDNAT